MPKSVYFGNHQYVGEQRLQEDLANEAIRLNGEDFFYLPRKLNNYDQTFNEDSGSSYEDAFLVAMYIKDSENGFIGGDFIFPGASGPSLITDSWTVVVARREFDLEVTAQNGQPRPFEGDLIFFPLNKKVYKVTFVEHESVFYQLGNLFVWELKCEMFKYSGETFNTGIPEVDAMTAGYGVNMNESGIALEDGEIVVDEFEQVPIEADPGDTTAFDNIGADNDYYQIQGNNIIDWTELDPFANNERF